MVRTSHLFSSHVLFDRRPMLTLYISRLLRPRCMLFLPPHNPHLTEPPIPISPLLDAQLDFATRRTFRVQNPTTPMAIAADQQAEEPYLPLLLRVARFLPLQHTRALSSPTHPLRTAPAQHPVLPTRSPTQEHLLHRYLPLTITTTMLSIPLVQVRSREDFPHTA